MTMKTVTGMTGRMVATTALMKLRRWGAFLFVCALLFLLGSSIYRRCLSAGTVLNQGRPFHVLTPGATARFVAQGTTDIHVLNYFVIDKNQPLKTSYALKLAFLSEEGTVYDQRAVQFSITTDDSTPVLADGARLAQLRLLPLAVPMGASVLQITSDDGRILLSANQLVANHGSQEAILEHSGRPATWFASDELQGLGTYSWATLPALDELPLIKLPFLTPLEEPGEDNSLGASAPMRIEPHRGLVINVTGPGSMAVALESDGDVAGRFQLEHVGPQGSGKLEIENGRASLNLPRGPSSVIMRSLNGTGATVRIKSQKLHTLGRLDEVLEPAGRLGSAWHLAENQPLRFGFAGQDEALGPVRITAHAIDVASPAAVTWRLLDAQDRELRQGTLPLNRDYDPFTAIIAKGTPADLGGESKIFVTPTADTAAIEVSAASAVIAVEMLLEESVEPEPLPPYNDALGPTLRWHDVPVRSPRWIMLRPLAEQSERRTLYAALLRMPRIEPIGPLPHGPWISVVPSGTPKPSQILERTERPSATQDIETLIPTGQELAVVLNGDGKNARRVVLTCDIAGQLGGELMLSIDGRRVSKSPISTSEVRLEANAPSGVHRVRIDGAPNGRCTVAARPASGTPTVRRTVYLMPATKGLTVKVRPHSKGPLRLHYAIYSERGSSHKDAQFNVLVDSGAPKRRVGSAATFTISRATQILHFAPSDASIALAESDSALRAVAVSAVQLGEDLPSGSHRIQLRALSSGRYWARFWIEGRNRRLDTAASIITTDLTESAPVQHGEVAQ